MSRCSICEGFFPGQGNKNNPFDEYRWCNTCNRKIKEGIYCDKMKYKRFDGITKQEFYDLNKTAIEDFIMEEYKEGNWQNIFTSIYSDIIDGD